MVSSLAQHDAELFCSTAKPQTKPERHQVPPTLIPGGQASPLRHPTVLRPGAGQVHHRHAPKSSDNLRSYTPSNTSHKIPRKPIYRAYSPETTTQAPRASLVAKDIEGFFTALDVPPLHVGKQSNPTPGRESPVQRCASPPVPPKVRLDEEASPRGQTGMLQSPPSRTGTTEEDTSSDSAPPPAYDENERVPPPPEKAQAQVHPASSEDSLPGSAAVSAARAAGSVAGVRADEAPAPKTTETDGETSQDSSSSSSISRSSPTEEDPEPKISGGTHRPSPSPPLPPRTPSPSERAPIQPDIATHVPGGFPPPPKRSPSPRSSPPQNGATGAAASSATAVGAAVAMPSTDFAHGGFERARNALGKHVQHMVYRAKEHHEQHLARKTSAHGSGAGFEVYVGV